MACHLVRRDGRRPVVVTGFDHEYDHRSYENAGHAIGIPYLPTAETTSSGARALGGTPAGNARAAADSWPRVLDWLESGLA